MHDRKERERREAETQYRHHARIAAIRRQQEEARLHEARNHPYAGRDHCEYCWRKCSQNPDVIAAKEAAHAQARAEAAAAPPPADPERAARHAARKAQRRREKEARQKQQQREIAARQKAERKARQKAGKYQQELLRAAKTASRIASGTLPPDVIARINERKRRLEREKLRAEKPWLFEPDVDVTRLDMGEFVDYLAGKNLGEHSFKKLHEERKARRQRKIYKNQQKRIKRRARERERQEKVLSDAKVAKEQWEEDMKQREADLLVEQARAAAAMIAQAAQHVLAGKQAARGPSIARRRRSRTLHAPLHFTATAVWRGDLTVA